MGMIIAFNWTVAALLAGRKTVTRRHWQPHHAAKFKEGGVVIAYDAQPRFGGVPVAEIRIKSITQEFGYTMPESDYEEEGFAFYDERPELRNWKKFPPPNSMLYHFLAWRKNIDYEIIYTVRFELVRVLPQPMEAKQQHEQLNLF